MKTTLKTIGLLAGILSITAFAIQNINWNIDPNYSIQFSGRKAGGTFSGLTGTIAFDRSNLSASAIDVTVDASTIKTGNSTKDKHAKGESWFDTDRFPVIKFKSASFIPAGDKTIVRGTLELHGVKKEIEIPFTFDDRGSKATFVGSFKVNRNDYGIKGNAFGFIVGNEFEVELKVPVTKK